MTTRLEIVTMALQKVNLESSSFTTVAAPLFVQEAYREVYNLFAKKGMHMLDTDQTLTLAATIALPAGFMSTIGVYRLDGTEYVNVRRLQPDQEAMARGLTGSDAIFYKVRHTSVGGHILQFYPAPTTGTYVLHYVPVCPTLSADGTVLITVGDSDALVACLLAMKFAGRENERYQALEDEYTRLLDAVARNAEEADFSPSTVQDTRRGQADSFSFNIYRGDD